MKEKILSLFNSPNYKPLEASQIANCLLDDSSQSFVKVIRALNELEREWIIMHDERNRFDYLHKFDCYEGVVDLKPQGFGFIRITDENYQAHDDVYIPKGDLLTALTNDVVIVKITYYSPKGPEGHVIAIKERNNIYIFGTLRKKGHRYIVYPNNPKQSIVCYIKKDCLNEAKPDQKVKAFITHYSNDGICQGYIVEVIGTSNEVGIDIKMAIASSMLKTTFDKETLHELDKYDDLKIDETILENSKIRDLREKFIITIDGDDAKDFDDAVSIEKLPNGNYLLGVYIADVAEYVKPQSALDSEALRRSFSIYLPNQVIPMLPEKLSNGLCSLQPNISRLVLAVVMEIDNKGNVIEHDIFEAVIKSKKRLTYNIANQILENKIVTETILDNTLKTMSELAEILYQKRQKRGSLDFYTLETSIILDDDCHVNDVIAINRGVSENIIEEFMIVTNECVAEIFKWLDVPFIYRVHDEPKADKLAKFKSLARILGYHLSEKGEIHPHALQTILCNSKQDKNRYIINNLLLRSMAKARYSDVNIGHYGLASNCYTHFTSPIRRYPDLLVHRIIKQHLLATSDSPQISQNEVAEVAKISSALEKRIDVLCHDVEDMLKCEYMANYIGKHFNGIISNTTRWGFYVQLENGIEGLVSLADFGPELYIYDENSMIWYAKLLGSKYQIGDKIEVTLMSSSKERREIDFAIYKHYTN